MFESRLGLGSVCVSSRASGFLPLSKDMHIRLNWLLSIAHGCECERLFPRWRRYRILLCINKEVNNDV